MSVYQIKSKPGLFDHNLTEVLTKVKSGDQIILDPGEYKITEKIEVSDLTIQGSSENASDVVLKVNLFAKNSIIDLKNLTLEPSTNEACALTLQRFSNLTLANVIIDSVDSPFSTVNVADNTCQSSLTNVTINAFENKSVISLKGKTLIQNTKIDSQLIFDSNSEYTIKSSYLVSLIGKNNAQIILDNCFIDGDVDKYNPIFSLKENSSLTIRNGNYKNGTIADLARVEKGSKLKIEGLEIRGNKQPVVISCQDKDDVEAHLKNIDDYFATSLQLIGETSEVEKQEPVKQDITPYDLLSQNKENTILELSPGSYENLPAKNFLGLKIIGKGNSPQDTKIKFTGPIQGNIIFENISLLAPDSDKQATINLDQGKIEFRSCIISSDHNAVPAIQLNNLKSSIKLENTEIKKNTQDNSYDLVANNGTVEAQDCSNLGNLKLDFKAQLHVINSTINLLSAFGNSNAVIEQKSMISLIESLGYAQILVKNSSLKSAIYAGKKSKLTFEDSVISYTFGKNENQRTVTSEDQASIEYKNCLLNNISDSMLIFRNNESHILLSLQIQDEQLYKEYPIAIEGDINSEKIINPAGLNLIPLHEDKKIETKNDQVEIEKTTALAQPQEPIKQAFENLDENKNSRQKDDHPVIKKTEPSAFKPISSKEKKNQVTADQISKKVKKQLLNRGYEFSEEFLDQKVQEIFDYLSEELKSNPLLPDLIILKIENQQSQAIADKLMQLIQDKYKLEDQIWKQIDPDLTKE